MLYLGIIKGEMNMFNIELKIPTYKEWKAQLEKLREQ
jgi:hypothetical protein